MTFGQIKSIIENNLLESYKNESDFKRSLKEFKHNVLSDKIMSKLYDLYGQLSSPQGLNESDAKDFLQEGVLLIQRLLTTVKLPKTVVENTLNKYSDIDTLIYTNNQVNYNRIFVESITNINRFKIYLHMFDFVYFNTFSIIFTMTHKTKYF